MNKSLFGVLIIIIVPLQLLCQNTFNHLVYYEFPVVAFKNVIATDSCFYVTGDFNDTIIPLKKGLIFSKFDLDGELLYSKTLKHSDKWYDSWYNDLTETIDGNFADIGILDDTTRKAFIVEYSPTGDTMVTKEYLSINYAVDHFILPIKLRQYPDGKYVSLNTHDNGTSNDISLLIMDQGFNPLHYTDYGHYFLNDSGRSLWLDIDGRMVVGGRLTNEGQVLSSYINKAWVFQTDSLGNVEWEFYSPPGELWHAVSGLARTPDNGVVAASGIGEEILVNPNNGLAYIFWDPVIFKLDTAQNLEWSTLLRSGVSSPLNEIVDMVNTNEGDFVILGNTGRDNPPLEYGRGVTIAKISSTGDSLWARYYILLGGVDYDIRPYDLDNTSDGGFILAGVDASNVTTTIPGWIMKVDEYGCLIPGCHLIDDTTTVTGNKIMPISKLVIYPNPAIDFLNFQLQNPAEAQGAFFRVLDLEGRLVREYGHLDASAVFSVPVRGWPMGVYFLQYWENGDLKQSERFVVGK